jgi:hypothetical protein
MIVWRSASVRKPAHRKDSQGVVRLFVQKIDSKPLRGVRMVHTILEPASLRQGRSARERTDGTYDFAVIFESRTYTL